ncbi:MAG: endo-1,4-beta-xylanase [Oscillospiraceae bacterium]|nr:endo-1,4-beta-xylanase [Oscillospiraceae bacterium]
MNKEIIVFSLACILFISLLSGCQTAPQNKPDDIVEPQPVAEPESRSEPSTVEPVEQPEKTEQTPVEAEAEPEVKPEHPIMKEFSEKEKAKLMYMQEPIVEDTSGLSLKDYYAERGILLGTFVTPDDYNDPWCMMKLEEQFACVIPMYEFKAGALLDQASCRKSGKLEVTFSEMAQNWMNWAKEKGIKLHGHTLFWHKETPDWIFREGFTDDGEYVSREIMLERMENYIASLFESLDKGGWLECFDSYDVINEYLSLDGSAPNESPWVDRVGEDYIYYAFLYADRYAPEYVKLVYNENYAEVDTNKRDAVIEMAKTLTDENGRSLTDCIGLQCHVYSNMNVEDICENIRYIAENSGLELQVTELDFTIMSSRDGIAMLKKEGTAFYKVCKTLLDLKEEGYPIYAFSTCGFCDMTSWMGARTAPHLYDIYGNEKYSYFAMLQMKELSGFEENAE